MSPVYLIDNRGGIHSASVSRMVGPNVSESIKTRQLVWNLQSQTPTTLRMLKGARPLTRDEWGQVIPPVLIIAGELVRILSSLLIFCRTEYVLRRMRRSCAHGYLMRKHQKPSLFPFPDTQS
jgi:hypothetical protein